MRPYVADLVAHRDVPHLVPPERRPAERVRRLRRDARRHLGAAARVRARRPPEHRGLVLRLDARAHPAIVDGGARARAEAGAAARGARRGSAASRRSRSASDTGFVLIGERTNVTGSARFRRLVEADDFAAAVAVALEQVRGGANLLDVNMDADLLEGEAGDAHVPERDRHRAGGCAAARSWSTARSGRCSRPGCSRPGEGHRQLDLAEGRRGRVPRARAAASATTARVPS